MCVIRPVPCWRYRRTLSAGVTAWRSRGSVSVINTPSTIWSAGVSARRRRSTPCAGTRAGSGTPRIVLVVVQKNLLGLAPQVNYQPSYF